VKILLLPYCSVQSPQTVYRYTELEPYMLVYTLSRPLQVVIRFLVKFRGRHVGLLIMSLFHSNMATKIHIAEQSYTHLVTKPHYHKSYV